MLGFFVSTPKPPATHKTVFAYDVKCQIGVVNCNWYIVKEENDMYLHKNREWLPKWWI